MGVNIRNKKEIDALRIPNKIVAKTLDMLSKTAKEGMSLEELDKMAEDFIVSNGAVPAFKGLYGFPKAICISVNEVIIHGIPDGYKLKNGDIVSFDIGAQKDGWYADAAITVGIGKIDDVSQKLIDVSKDVLYKGIDFAKPGVRFKELSKFLGDEITKAGYFPLRNFCGHGIGRAPHESPEIPNYLDAPNANSGEKIKEGMVFCIEPMICQTSGEPKILEDDWAVVSMDGLRGVHYEHTIAIVDGKAEILTKI